jgi:hypothetical protein
VLLTQLARALGEVVFARLPRVVREAHSAGAVSRWSGEVTVRGASNPLCWLVARFVGFPRSGTMPVSVKMHMLDADTEVWHRTMGAAVFKSVITYVGPGVCTEQFGVFRFHLAVRADESALRLEVWHVRQMRSFKQRRGRF